MNYLIVGLICAILVIIFLRARQPTPPPTCVPTCAANSCGDDGCGGICACPTGMNCQNGQCQPNCANKSCGSDGHGGSCGTCPAGQICTNGACVEDVCNCDVGEKCVDDVCQPSNYCVGKQCGDDGHGNNCGNCTSDKTCVNNQCVIPAAPPPAPKMSQNNYVYCSWFVDGTKDLLQWSENYSGSSYLDSDLVYNLRVVYYDSSNNPYTYISQIIPSYVVATSPNGVAHRNSDELPLDMTMNTHNLYLSSISQSSGAASAETAFKITSNMPANCQLGTTKALIVI